MKEIIPPEISIDEFRVEELDLSKKFLNISLKYVMSIETLKTEGRLFRRFILGDNVINFILNCIDDLKKISGAETAKFRNKEEIKEKLVNTLSRLVLETKDLKKIKDHEKYIQAYNKINCYKAVFEI